MIELRGVSKVFGSHWANRNVHLKLSPGSVHALVGENGAGKSTAMKILTGELTPDEGGVAVRGQIQSCWDPLLSAHQGLGMVHQHFMLADTETVLDNICLGREDTFLGFRRISRERERLTKLMEATGLHVDLGSCIQDLSVGMRSRVEILKVLDQGADYLILDEPTSVLTPPEVVGLLQTLKKLKSQGKAILFVSHKLKEVFEIADEITVLRAGQTVAHHKTSEVDMDTISKEMVGSRSMTSIPPFAKMSFPEKQSWELPLHGCSIKAGEIVGIAGVEGNGQEALIQAIHEQREKNSSNFGIVFPDRIHQSSILSLTLRENLALGRENLKMPAFSHFSGRNKMTAEFLTEHRVHPSNPRALLKQLSGGNQQKLVMARELFWGSSSIEKLLICHPTRGVDFASSQEIHSKILQLKSMGAHILVISSDLDELMILCDRIGVLYRGQITSWLNRDQFNEHVLGKAMTQGVA